MKSLSKLIIILIILLILLFLLKYLYKNNYVIEKYINHNIYFPDKLYVDRIIKKSDYFDNLTKEDLIARHYNGFNYRKYFISNIKDFSHDEKRKLILLTQEINEKIKKINIKNNKNINNYINIDWKIIKISNNIENGFPHTHGDIIILPEWILNSHILSDTLIHEKVHIYQRLYENDHDNLLASMGFNKINIDNKLHLKQSNPDIKYDYIYNNTYTYKKYKSTKPTKIMDAYDHAFDINNGEKKYNYFPNYISQHDHPYEIVASIFPLLINNSLETDYFNSSIKKWFDIT